ncbi:MAG TPA: hypothetical protein VG269_11825 [Tepidisphaeraceae bacterium]|jgi:hypothetical protein|nr:hypothetical protein [Tepidisphaeraceae bacterium]
MSRLEYQKLEDYGGETRRFGLRSLFGATANEAWRQFAYTSRATFTPRGAHGSSKITAHHGPWTLVLDTHVRRSGRRSMRITRLRVPYVDRSDLRFRVRTAGLLDAFTSLFITSRVSIGPEFDREFILTGSHVREIKALFSDPRLPFGLAGLPPLHLHVSGGRDILSAWLPPGTAMLYLEIAGVLKNPAAMYATFDVGRVLLEGLQRIGATVRTDPGANF